jgi:hypothetical protein
MLYKVPIMVNEGGGRGEEGEISRALAMEGIFGGFSFNTGWLEAISLSR